MKVTFSNKGVITIMPTDSIDEYALAKWTESNKVGCDKIVIETTLSKPMGFKVDKEESDE